MKIATVSLNQLWENKKANLLNCKKYIENASFESVDLIVFPEMTLTGFSTNIEETMENLEKSETVYNFIELAISYNIAILFGVVIKDGNKALNQTIFIDNKGEILGRYSKVHPFSFAGEDKYFNAGNNLTIVNFMNHKIGLTICYDLRFPELYSAYAKECDTIVTIANWPQKRVAHWNTLLKARAIENQLFIVGVNRIGIDGNNLEYQESSNLFNANGDIVESEVFEEMKIFEIEKSFTKEFKTQFNTTNDRKIEFYKEII